MKQNEYSASTPPMLTRLKRLLAWRLFGRSILYLILMICTITLAIFIYLDLFDEPRSRRLMLDNSEIIDRYRLLEERIKAAESRVMEIAYRDNFVYRSLFALDTLNIASWNRPYPETHYTNFDDNPYSDMIQNQWRDLDLLAKKIYFQSLSFDEIQPMVKNSTDLSEAIPAIWPIDRTELDGGIGAFGRRLHPIYKRYLDHKGVDMACELGTPIYATGNAVVEKSEQGYRKSGYGQMLLLKHEYGYQTRYGHLSKRLVNIGDSVKRGEVIGLVGSTGGSTGPHLHYEVIYRGVPVNPISFFNRNMSKEEYQQLMEQVHVATLDGNDEE